MYVLIRASVFALVSSHSSGTSSMMMGPRERGATLMTKRIPAAYGRVQYSMQTNVFICMKCVDSDLESLNTYFILM
jgi:hypothetical protein